MKTLIVSSSIAPISGGMYAIPIQDAVTFFRRSVCHRIAIILLAGCGSPPSSINTPNWEIYCVTHFKSSEDIQACVDAHRPKIAPNNLGPSQAPPSNFARLAALLSGPLAFDDVMTLLNSNTDAQIAAMLTQEGVSASDFEAFLAGLNPQQKAQIYAALPKSRFYSIMGNITDHDAKLYYWLVYWQMGNDNAVPPGW